MKLIREGRRLEDMFDNLKQEDNEETQHLPDLESLESQEKKGNSKWI